jgi:putative heme-binding domain-containing protein
MQSNWAIIAIAMALSIAYGEQFANSQTKSNQQRLLNERLIAEDPMLLAREAREKGDIVRGAILFHQGNINCAKCHRPGAGQDRIGPDLSEIGADVSDSKVIESLLQPSKEIKEGYETFLAVTEKGQTINGTKVSEDDEKIVFRDVADVDKLITVRKENLEGIRPAKLSSMPADLANELKNRQQFLDLLRYVFDQRERGSAKKASANKVVVRRKLEAKLHGLMLMQERNCVACHASNSSPSSIVAKQAPKLKWSASRLNPEYIAKFIADPGDLKLGSTMPRILSGMDDDKRKQNANAITHFLLSKSGNQFRREPIDGEAMHRGYELFNSVGCVACHAPRDESANELPMSESQTLGDLSNKYSISSLTEFLEDPLAVRISGHMPNMRLDHKEAVDIANYLLQSENTAEFKPWQVDDTLAAEGATLFQQNNCSNCHADFVDNQIAGKFTDLDKLNLDQGCLSDKPGNWPDFRFTPEDTEAVKAALKSWSDELDSDQQIELTLTSFNCIACHSRNDLGGVTLDRNPHFKTEDLNLGDQGRIPPTLTGVGAKLKPKWMRDVMVNGRSIRPYMNTRMPQFGKSNIAHLLTLLQESDHLSETKFATFEDQKETRQQGHLLAGAKGLNCVACHTYQYKTSDTMPAVDLTEMAERLEKDWFYQYMLDPQRFSPNTVMPSFWPGGKGIRPDIAGTPEDQVEAIWQYLLDGRQARAPAGVVREPLEIVVTDEAKMLRRQYPGIGKRGIGVGYPGNVNIAFDAEQLRLASIWKGKFVEASAVWRGQGSGNVRLLGRPVDFATGPDLDDAKRPLITDKGRPPNHHFKGYVLDGQRRPTFRYEFEEVKVTDYFVQITDEERRRLQRTVSLESKVARDGLRFRVATAKSISQKDESFLVGENLRVRVLSDHDASIVKVEDGYQLQIPVSITPDQQLQLRLEYFWK